MKNKINFRLVAVSILAVVITLCSITAIYYRLFQEQVRNDLKLEATLLSEAGISELIRNNEIIGSKDIRITWISEDGEVLFDNDVDADNLNNHLNRPEVKDAFATGRGESVRESDTMNMKNYYYAVKLSDGTVLRVAREARSLVNVFLSVSPIVVGIILLILMLCIVVSRLLTRQLLKPIAAMAEDIDGSSSANEYSELEPFIRRIREQHEDILAAARSRQDFTANVSHELKTPVTAISGYAELIENGMVSDEQRVKFAGDIRKNADNLVVLVNDIIRLSELDRNEIRNSFSNVDLNEVAKERVDLLQGTAFAKNVKLSFEGEAAVVHADRGMMIELIDNLVQNAIRYNVSGGSVRVSVANEGARKVLSVKDTGIGIPKADQQRIFERFYRVDKSRSRATGGTGLGLAIVKHIVELHHGTISVDSEVGGGTEIRVEF